jgi:hypothetical protein
LPAHPIDFAPVPLAEPDRSSAAHAALVRQLDHARAMHAERAANPILDGAMQRLADWQSARLAQTYADLAAQPRYRDAVAFFQSDLYGGEEIAKRDADLAGVVPIMVAVLPQRVIGTIAEAMELSVMSQELDRVLLGRLPRADGPFSVAEYCRAYRRAGNLPARHRQIELIGTIGTALDRYVRQPLLRGALAMMRKPARMSGHSALHDFLERGFGAFRRMGGAAEFLSTIEERETALMNRIADGANDPFSDPMDLLGLRK